MDDNIFNLICDMYETYNTSCIVDRDRLRIHDPGDVYEYGSRAAMAADMITTITIALEEL